MKEEDMREVGEMRELDWAATGQLKWLLELDV